MLLLLCQADGGGIDGPAELFSNALCENRGYGLFLIATYDTVMSGGL